MSKQIRDLKAKKSGLAKEAQAIIDAATAAGTEMTEEQTKQFDVLMVQVKGVQGMIERLEQLAAETVQAPAAQVAQTIVSGGEPAITADPKRGYQSLGQFALDVRQATTGFGISDRLQAATMGSVTANEGSGAQGGFLVPPEFAEEIFTLSLEEDALLPMTTVGTTSGNSMVYKQSEDTPWSTDGVQVYWEHEMAAAKVSAPNFGNHTMHLHKLLGMVVVSDELLADAQAMDTHLRSALPSAVRWKINAAIMWGSGGQEPFGCMRSGAVITVPKEAGQAAGTVVIENIDKMVATLPPGSLRNARWMMHNTVWPKLRKLNTLNDLAFVSGTPANPYGTLSGLPIMVTQLAEELSSEGDISLVDLRYYRTLTKPGMSTEIATSMHLFFDQGATAYRVTVRLDGGPKVSKPIKAAKGNFKMSPFVMLGAR
ncbi:MAG: phage major capsid protein [Magnetococcus sp. YQC-5]